MYNEFFDSLDDISVEDLRGVYGVLSEDLSYEDIETVVVEGINE